VDDLDIEILNYLKTGSRKSLKKLADTLEQKTSTIYHRLTRLKSNNVILGFSLIFNPDFLREHKISSIRLKVKPLNINSLDDMFIKSFANFISNEFDNVLFIALSEEARMIHLLSISFSEDQHEKFIEELTDNPYIESIEYEHFSHIVKGQNILGFNEDWVRKEEKEEEEEEEEHELEGRTMEIDFGDEEELKF